MNIRYPIYEGVYRILTIKKSFGRQKMLGTAKPSGVIFFGTKGEDRNSFVSIHRNKFAVQKQRISDGAMKKAH